MNEPNKEHHTFSETAQGRDYNINLQDAIRIALPIVLCILLFAPDWTTLVIVKFVAGFLMAVSMLTHLVRRILFPYMDFKEYMRKALEDPVGSGLVVLGVSLIIAVTIFVTAQFFNNGG